MDRPRAGLDLILEVDSSVTAADTFSALDNLVVYPDVLMLNDLLKPEPHNHITS